MRKFSRSVPLYLAAAVFLATSGGDGRGLARAQEVSGVEAEKFADTGVAFDDLTKLLTTASATSMKPVGTSSLVFKVALKSDAETAFKPATRQHPEGYLAEVWAYRVARVLGLTNVVPVIVRSFGLEEIKGLLRGRYRDRWQSYEQELVVRQGRVVGAAIHWIRGMRELGLDGDAGVARWSQWLSQSEPLPESPQTRALAAQVSNMVGFDYLIGNWDRFSGANAQGNADGSVVYLRDHNVAFAEPLTKTQQARLLLRLQRVQRFSRMFVTHLKAFNRANFERAFQDAKDVPSLREAQWSALEERRLTLLSYVAALIEQYGEARVLPFP